MSKIKLKDNVNLEEIDCTFNLDTEVIDGDYETGFHGDVEQKWCIYK